MPVVEKNYSDLLNELRANPGEDPATSANAIKAPEIGEGSLQSWSELWRVIMETVRSNRAIVRARIDSQKPPHP
jgi:hypothetical protein